MIIITRRKYAAHMMTLVFQQVKTMGLKDSLYTPFINFNMHRVK